MDAPNKSNEPPVNANARLDDCQLVPFGNGPETFRLLVCELEPWSQGTRQMFALLFFNSYIEQAQLDASGFRCGHNLLRIKTPRSIRVGDFPLLHDYSVAFNQRLQHYKVIKLSTNPAVAYWPRSTLCLGITRGWQTTLADCQRDLRGTSKLDAILEWRLTFSDFWVEPRLFGTTLRFEELGALGSDIA